MNNTITIKEITFIILKLPKGNFQTQVITLENSTEYFTIPNTYSAESLPKNRRGRNIFQFTLATQYYSDDKKRQQYLKKKNIPYKYPSRIEM